MTSGRENSGGGYSPLESISRHLGAADEHVVLLVVGAGLGGPHPLALQAEEGVLEEEGGEPDLLFLELVEDVLGVVVAVERLAAGVLAWPAWSRPTMKWVQP